MTEEKAKAIASALGGVAWHSGGSIWLVTLRRGDGHLVVVSDDAVYEYEDQAAFEDGREERMILLANG